LIIGILNFWAVSNIPYFFNVFIFVFVFLILNCASLQKLRMSNYDLKCSRECEKIKN
jgi:hypothetical protein